MDQLRALVALFPEMLQDRDEGISETRGILGSEDSLRRTYYAAMSTVFFPDILGVKVAPISPMRFLR